MIRRRMREYARYVIAIVGFAIVALVAGTYIAVHQRLALPFEDRYELRAQFASSESLEPGLGQPANVAGVRVGDITGATLRDGRSTVTMSILRSKLPRVYANARATLHPNTPLKDMQIDIDPGSAAAPVLRGGAAIPLIQTQVPHNADDFTNALDADTRAYFDALVQASGAGLHRRGPDLRALLRNIGPTAQQADRLLRALRGRRVALARLVHNLAVLATAASSRDRQLQDAVGAGDRTLHALASQDTALRAAVAQLPGTLAAASRSLTHTAAFAGALRPALHALDPTIHALPGALHAARPLLDAATPLLRGELPALLRAGSPVLADLRPTSADLTASTPDLSGVFGVLQYLSNELVYAPGGAQHGYLFWLAWFAHTGASMLSTGDAHGAVWRGLGLGSCNTLSSQPASAPLVSAISGLSAVCPPTGGP